MDDTTQQHPFLVEIEKACEVMQISPTEMGYRLARDYSLVHNLRRGRMLRPSTVERYREALRAMGAST